jgi:myo-inositol-1(or 4)-monophosphatase
MMTDRLTLAKTLARQSGALLREGYGRASQVNLKGEIDLITEYDLLSEKLLIEGIREAFPGDAILAEESGRRGDGAGWWLIDPLDGTVNFAHGLPIFAVSIAYVEGESLKFGVIFNPMLDEFFVASSEGGAWLNDQPLHVSSVDALNDSLLVTGFPYDVRTAADNNLERHAALSLLSRGVRRLGSAALDLAYVAAGRLEGYWEIQSSPWDVGAGSLMVLEAGGRVTRIDGSAVTYTSPSSIVATNGLIHDEFLAALNQNDTLSE